MNKRIILITLVISILFTSCVTKSLWSNNKYKESIQNFLLSKDGKKLLIIGKKHHYIFSIDDNLKEVLLSKRKKNISPFFSIFKLNEHNIISGVFTLNYSAKKIEIDDKKWLKENGFTLGDSTNRYKKTISIAGQRYLANEIKIPTSQFNKKYYINIDTKQYKYNTAERLLLSPVAVVADGILVIGTIALFVVFAKAGGTMPDFNYHRYKEKKDYEDKYYSEPKE